MMESNENNTPVQLEESQPEQQQQQNQEHDLDLVEKPSEMQSSDLAAAATLENIVSSIVEKCDENNSSSLSSSSSTLTKSASNESSLSSIKSDDNSINEKETEQREEQQQLENKKQTEDITTTKTSISTKLDEISTTTTIQHVNNEDILTIQTNTIQVENKTTEMRNEKNSDENVINVGEAIKLNYRYSKQFLEKIRSDRAKFIADINPDIFKAYCYCMNGKFWNPEKYFDVVQYQFPDELDKVKKVQRNNVNIKPQSHQQPQQQQQSQQHFNQHQDRRQNLHQHQQQQPPQQRRNSENRNRMNSSASSRRSTSSINKQNKSVSKQQNKLNQSKDSKSQNSCENKFQQANDLTHSEADKVLLNLLKINTNLKSTSQENRTEMSASAAKATNILEKLLPKSPPLLHTQPTKPVNDNHILSLLNKSPNQAVLTAHELEQQQLLNRQNSHQMSIIEKLFQKQQQQHILQKLQINQMNKNDDLNNNLINKLQFPGIIQPPRPQQQQQQQLQQTETKFPTTTPQENPFQNFLNKNHENQLNQTINNALNQILKSSSSSSASSLVSSTVPSSSSSSTTTSPSKLQQQQQQQNNMEHLLSKLNIQQQQQQQQKTNDHFNVLLHKISVNPAQAQQQPQQLIEQKGSIFKWFPNPQSDQFAITRQKLPNNATVMSLNDIEKLLV